MEHNADAILKLVNAGFTKQEINALYGVNAISPAPAPAQNNVSSREQAPETDSGYVDTDMAWRDVTQSLVDMVKDLQEANRALLNGQSPKPEQNVDDIVSGFLMNGGFNDGNR